MLIQQLSLAFVGLVPCFELGDADYLGDARGEIAGEGRVSNDVFHLALRVAGYETYCCSR